MSTSTSSTSSTSSNASLHPQLQIRLKRILETRTDSTELLLALNHLGSFYKSNTVQDRLDLLDNIEDQGIQIHRDFLEAFSKVQSSLQQVQQDVQVMTSACNNITSRLDATQTVSKELTSQSAALQHEKYIPLPIHLLVTSNPPPPSLPSPQHSSPP
eukprot:TRINITY_DN347_c0_g1_i4.p1 TRINITY_DN347_c0_g1~~TRINITY_DN347_c0_g1_i4.p1  ORF type:complete len:157 (+),score=44.76 TRINITY_DN347_c0_g1_i4:1549-2019(+)